MFQRLDEKRTRPWNDESSFVMMDPDGKLVLVSLERLLLFQCLIVNVIPSLELANSIPVVELL